MSDLHPSARALINAAKRGEGALPSEARARVHRSVLRRAVAVGAAVATTGTASAVSKAAALLAAGLTSPLAIPGVLGAVAGVAFLVLRVSAPSVPPQPHPMDQAAPTHAVSPSLPRAPPSIGATKPNDATQAVEATKPNDATQAVEATQAMALHASKAPALTTRPVAVPARGTPATATAARAEERSAEANESASTIPTEDGSRAPTAVAASTSKPSSAAPGADLASDLERLRQVRAALRAHQPEAALSLLDHGGRALDLGPLAEEAQVARVSALCQLGRSDDARTAADRFLVAWPASPLAARMRGGCSGIGTNSKPGAD